MADTEAQKIVESTVEEKKVEEKEKLVEKLEKEEAKAEENGDDKAENGNSKEESKEKDDESKEEPISDKCSIKRKSTGGDAVDGKTEESTPEKKAKLDEAPAETEANGEVTEAEAAA